MSDFLLDRFLWNVKARHGEKAYQAMRRITKDVLGEMDLTSALMVMFNAEARSTTRPTKRTASGSQR